MSGMEQIITLKVNLEYPDEARHAIDEATKAYEESKKHWDAFEINKAKSRAQDILYNLCNEGYYKIAEILNVEMKESETQFGKYGEDLATKLLEEHGFAVERMSTRYAYDLYVNGSVKVDVKTARLSKANKSFCYSFNLEKTLSDL